MLPHQVSEPELQGPASWLGLSGLRLHAPSMDSMCPIVIPTGLQDSRSRDARFGFRLARARGRLRASAAPRLPGWPVETLAYSSETFRASGRSRRPAHGSPAPFCEENVARSRPDRPPSPSLDAAFSLGLAACLDRIAKMPRIHFYNRRSHHEHPSHSSPLETARRGAWETRRSPTSRSLARERCCHLRPRALPDRLAVIRPPIAARLTARRQLRVDRAPLLLALSRQRGKAPKPCRLAGASSIEPSDTSCGRPERGPLSRRDSSRLSQDSPGHVNETGLFRGSRCLPSEKPAPNPLSRARRGALPPLAGGGSRRTCSSRLKATTRPFHAAFACAWRPRALLRFLQVSVATSTTTDRSNPRAGGIRTAGRLFSLHVRFPGRVRSR
jgi:hypothetical protein